jgi:hypothetical protein
MLGQVYEKRGFPGDRKRKNARKKTGYQGLPQGRGDSIQKA